MGYISIFGFASILFNVIIFLNISESYRECLGFICMLFNVIIFLVLKGSQRYLGIWVKILKFAGMLFIYLKVASKQSVPRVSIIHFYYPLVLFWNKMPKFLMLHDQACSICAEVLQKQISTNQQNINENQLIQLKKYPNR